MSRVPAQLPLGVGLRDDATFNNYYASSANASLVDHLSHQLMPGSEPCVYILGAPGPGRSPLFAAAGPAAA
ncbi:MAG: DnaA regulatory inactivator Hda, partial [Pseudomonadota bacterium]|nr:DnaA regulatory inactivator Hda [Pseudomonadota bacterium]